MSQEKTMRLSIKVVTGAAKTALAGMEGEYVKVRLAAPPVDGKANEALFRFLSRQLDLPPSCITIRSGVTSRRKVLQLERCQEQRLKDFLAMAANAPKQK
jgi:uncharacterized protein (TIGR00251 family)